MEPTPLLPAPMSAGSAFVSAFGSHGVHGPLPDVLEKRPGAHGAQPLPSAKPEPAGQAEGDALAVDVAEEVDVPLPVEVALPVADAVAATDAVTGAVGEAHGLST